MNEYYLVLSLKEINALKRALLADAKSENPSRRVRSSHTIVLTGLKSSGPKYPDQINCLSFDEAVNRVWKAAKSRAASAAKARALGY